MEGVPPQSVLSYVPVIGLYIPSLTEHLASRISRKQLGTDISKPLRRRKEEDKYTQTHGRCRKRLSKHPDS